MANHKGWAEEGTKYIYILLALLEISGNRTRFAYPGKRCAEFTAAAAAIEIAIAVSNVMLLFPTLAPLQKSVARGHREGRGSKVQNTSKIRVIVF